VQSYQCYSIKEYLGTEKSLFHRMMPKISARYRVTSGWIEKPISVIMNMCSQVYKETEYS
jgi:hypothetical protein